MCWCRGGECGVGWTCVSLSGCSVGSGCVGVVVVNAAWGGLVLRRVVVV